MLSRVFDLFTQVDRSLDRAEGGLGIGLTLVRRLMEKHGGSVQARSEGPGRGSEFILRLPSLAGVGAQGDGDRRRPAGPDHGDLGGPTATIGPRPAASSSSTTMRTPRGAWPGCSGSPATS